jgi:hypothetical protein
MRHYIRYFIICCLALSYFGCNSQQQKKDDSVNNSSSKENSRQEKEALSQNTNAIGPFHWGINDDAFCKFLKEWTTQLTKNGFVTIAGIKVKSNGILPHYDKDGHLEKITIAFQKFSIHPEQDYTEEEKSQIDQMLLNHSKKITQLIGALSDSYGDPIENNFEESSVGIYSFSGLKTITQWHTHETHVSLNIQNKTYPGMTGCEMEVWVELKKIY